MGVKKGPNEENGRVRGRFQSADFGCRLDFRDRKASTEITEAG